MAEEAKPARPATGTTVAAWSLGLFAACRAIEITLAAQSLAALVGQGVLVEWASSRLGLAWTDPSTPTTGPRIAARVAGGFGIGLGMAAAIFAVLTLTRAVAFEEVPHVEISVLALGFVAAALTAWRDELLLHGLTLRALHGSTGPVAGALACGATSAGAALGRTDATARTVVAAGLVGVVLGVLWVHDRGGWRPWAAHTGLRFATGTLLAGGLVHGRLAEGAWAGGSSGPLAGSAAAVALAPVGVLALGWMATRGISPRSPRVG